MQAKCIIMAWYVFTIWWKSTFSIMRTRGSCETHKEKTTKFQMSNQHLGVNQLLGITNNRCATNFFLRFSSWALHEPLVRMMEKVLFSWFSNIFHRSRSCKRMRKHAFAGRNMQHRSQPCLASFFFYLQVCQVNQRKLKWSRKESQMRFTKVKFLLFFLYLTGENAVIIELGESQPWSITWEVFSDS